MASYSTKERPNQSTQVQLVPPSSFSTIRPNENIKRRLFHTAADNPCRHIFSPSHPFIAHDPSFLLLLGRSPSLTVLVSSSTGEKFAHEAPVYWEETNEVYFSSNQYGTAQDVSAKTFAVNVSTGARRELTWSPSLILPNGAIRFGDQLLWCCQGRIGEGPSEMVLSEPATGKTRPLASSFFGRAFNSLNDVAVLPPPKWTRGGIVSRFGRSVGMEAFTTASTELHEEMGTSVWFTDPNYGFEQKFKAAPQLPTQVYCINPHTGSIRAVADGFIKPNGIAFNLEGSVCFISDTAYIAGTGVSSPNLPGTIYAFDVQPAPAGADLTVAGPTLSNRRVFAFTDAGAPDGVKCDRNGNVYAGCFDGLHVWSPQGTLLGRICFFPDPASPFPTKARGCANFCFVPGGIVMCAEDRLYFAKIEGGAQGALLPAQGAANVAAHL